VCLQISWLSGASWDFVGLGALSPTRTVGWGSVGPSAALAHYLAN
jgi:hypothetical protein